ncbi:MAG: flagellar protein FliL [Bdellovibrionaceae bacterium]|nr:flagellar protein FliL [Pseudobdellovibrionaceae bacterium]|tara:strand:- start:49761 stop:50267 length:507 start_codon:yes stop_codon:yes gene_type:complete
MAEEEKEEKPKAKGNSGKLFAMLFVVVNLAFMGAGSYWVYMQTLGYEKPMVSEDELNKELEEFKESLRGESVLFAMDSLTTNLDGIPRRMIRVDLSIEMLDEEGFEEIIGVEAEARDSIMRIINNKRFSDVESVQGKLKLKNEIITGINHFLQTGVVKNIYFTDFLVQ